MSMLTDAAARLGKMAARLGRDATACPYDPASDDPEIRAAADAWMRTYLHWAPPAGHVDYSGGDQ